MHAAVNSSVYSCENMAYMFAFVFIVTAGCVFAQTLLKMIPYAFSLMWIANMILSYTEMFKYKALPFGLPQNVNWNAALIIITSAFFILVILRHVRNTAWRTIIICAVLVPSVHAFWRCDSRGAILSLAVVCVLAAILHTGKKKRKYLYFGLASAVAAAAILGLTVLKGELAYFAHDDERPFFAKAALNMIFDSPVAGCGSLSFE